MSLSLHHEKLTHKAFAVQRMIRRTFSRITRMEFQMLYAAYVRQRIEYAKQVVHSGRTKDCPRLRGDLILTYVLFEQGWANRFFTVDPANTRRGHGERQPLNDKNKIDPGILVESLDPVYQSANRTFDAKKRQKKSKKVAEDVDEAKGSEKVVVNQKENGGLRYLSEESPDFLSIQETKCASDKIPAEAHIEGYEFHWSSAEKNGYAGTALYSKTKPLNITRGVGKTTQNPEGRVITAEFPDFYLVSAYVPNSGQGLVRLPYRQHQWDPEFRQHLKQLDKIKPIIVTGDLNVAHEEIESLQINFFSGLEIARWLRRKLIDRNVWHLDCSCLGLDKLELSQSSWFF
ncbi:AP endonuclease 1 [Clonorchis sinensis]|uniref:exodeoxyribonuclease III n=1 Tax=Clonorchis sinensis TaxID=79923 RepID=G7YXZ6_CLOSI|nr:AP endonuclease 1 [Clonorchis sinensis]